MNTHYKKVNPVGRPLSEETMKKRRLALNRKRNWGGSREGAGRPPSEEPTLTETIAFRVEPEVKAKYRALKDKGMNVNDKLAETIISYAAALGIR